MHELCPCIFLCLIQADLLEESELLSFFHVFRKIRQRDVDIVFSDESQELCHGYLAVCKDVCYFLLKGFICFILSYKFFYCCPYVLLSCCVRLPGLTDVPPIRKEGRISL